MLQLPDLPVSDNTQLVLGAAASLGRDGLKSMNLLLLSAQDLKNWASQSQFLTAAVEIMEKQGGLLVDRPRIIAVGEMLSGGLATGFTHAGDKLRQPKAAEAYQPLQMSHAKNIVLDILEDPSNFQDHAAVYSATTITKVAYGKSTLTSATDPEVKELKYLAWYGKDLRREFETNRRLYTNQLNRVKHDVDSGPSFTKHMLENDGVHGLTETDMAFLAGSFFSAGSRSTAMSICTVFMAAACFPEEQAKAQAELDAVIGRHRAPIFANEQSLPLLRAFISDALGWRPFAPNSGYLH
ncbi:cytochrome P450 [Suillus ampliporus]|nr:cytochrome P450 [Suillus ampliporus]